MTLDDYIKIFRGECGEHLLWEEANDLEAVFVTKSPREIILAMEVREKQRNISFDDGEQGDDARDGPTSQSYLPRILAKVGCSGKTAWRVMKYTKHQTARGAFPDGQKGAEIYLFKNVSTLRSTYQIRLLTYLASESGKKLIIEVPQHFKPHHSLARLIKEFPKTLQIDRTP